MSHWYLIRCTNTECGATRTDTPLHGQTHDAAPPPTCMTCGSPAVVIASFLENPKP